MNQPNRWIRAAALTSSCVLAFGFVLYRSGALNTSHDRQNERAANGNAVSVAVHPDTPSTKPEGATPKVDTAPRRSRFFGGSKSGVPMIETPRDTHTANADTTSATSDTIVSRREVFMGGSKSLAPMIQTPKQTGADTPSRK